MKRKKHKGRTRRFGESVKPTSVSMPGTLRRIAQEHADARGVSFSELVVDCMFSGLLAHVRAPPCPVNPANDHHDQASRKTYNLQLIH